mgnify:CR=1 FL=1
MSKFKVGDWVYDYYGNLIQVDEFSILKEDELENFKLWQPQDGEWCWFWDKDTPFPERPFIDRHCGDYCGESYISETKFSGNSYWTNCEPFIGEIPNFIKE